MGLAPSLAWPAMTAFAARGLVKRYDAKDGAIEPSAASTRASGTAAGRRSARPTGFAVVAVLGALMLFLNVRMIRNYD
jgi:hypothetical protein